MAVSLLEISIVLLFPVIMPVEQWAVGKTVTPECHVYHKSYPKGVCKHPIQKGYVTSLCNVYNILSKGDM